MTLRDKIMLLFEADAWKGYLKEAYGYPAILTNCMNEDLQAITVYGNNGGVGDTAVVGGTWRTVASADMQGYSAGNGNITKLSGSTIGQPISNYLTGNNSFCTYYINAAAGDKFNVVYMRLGTYMCPIVGTDSSGVIVWYNKNGVSSLANYEFTVPEGKNIARIYFSARYGSAPNTSYFNVQRYIPEYGYKIPILFGDKTINLYSPSALGDADALFAGIPNKIAELTKNGTVTDISGIQDWEQNLVLPNADKLTVTADTTVEPSSIKVEYYSSSR